MARQKIDEAVKQKVFTAHASGLPMRRIAKEYGISLSSVSRVVNEKIMQEGQVSNKKTGKAERQKRIEEIERKIAELEKKVLEVEAKKKLWGK